MIYPQGLRPEAFTYYARLTKVKKHLDQHISEDMPLRKAANIAGMEEKYFSTFFHVKTGICFKDWLTYVRVNRAMEIMKTRNHSITNIALEVGFQELRTFERAFKKCNGMTPQAFKRSVRPS